MNKIKNTIQQYIENKMSLKEFEDKIILFLSEYEMNILDDIEEDIAYTTTGELTQEEKEMQLISEKDLKNKLKEYLKQF